MRKLCYLAIVAGLCAPVLGAQAPQGPWPPPGVVALPAPGIAPPVVIERGTPVYTRAAMVEKIQGVVGLSCVIEVDGSVGDARVVRSLDKAFGLDDQAIAAAKRWRFKPATKDGVPVRVLVPISIGFTLKGEPPASTWPALFPGGADAPASSDDWAEARAGASGVTVRVPHPRTWEARSTGTGPLITIMSPGGRQFVQIGEPRALPKPIPLPLPVGQLDQAIQSLSKTIGTHDFRSIGGGQAKGGDRWWLWQDQTLPASATSRLPPDVRDVLNAEFDGMRLWIFVTSVDVSLVTVFCWALLPRGLAPADLERELRPATAVFDRMIKQMVLEKRGA
jgi:TonB family protein